MFTPLTPSNSFEFAALGDLARSIAVQTAKNPRSPLQTFINDLPLLAADAMKSAGLRLTPDVVDIVIATLYDPESDTLIVMDPNYDPEAEALDAADAPDDPGTGFSFSDIKQEVEAEQFLHASQAPLADRVAAALAARLRTHLDLPGQLADDEVMSRVRGLFIEGLADELEHFRPGIMTDKKDPFWNLDSYGLSALVKEHAELARHQFSAIRVMPSHDGPASRK